MNAQAIIAKCAATGFVVLSVAIWSSAAEADAIDGNWCHGAKRLSISGPEIVTPGGAKMSGEYGRHDFRYVVPAGEAGAGNTVEMDLLSDDDMQLWPNGRTSQPQAGGAQMWKRCAAPVS